MRCRCELAFILTLQARSLSSLLWRGCACKMGGMEGRGDCMRETREERKRSDDTYEGIRYKYVIFLQTIILSPIYYIFFSESFHYNVTWPFIYLQIPVTTHQSICPPAFMTIIHCEILFTWSKVRRELWTWIQRVYLFIILFISPSNQSSLSAALFETEFLWCW